MRRLCFALFVVAILKAARQLWIPEARELGLALSAAIITLALVLLEDAVAEWWRERHPAEEDADE